MNTFLLSLSYVISDPFFWPSMAFTTMIGIFLGAVVYDGELNQVRKFIISLFFYVILLITVNLTRAFPDIMVISEPYKPLSSTVTTLIITLFYLLGVFLGVYIVKRAHK